MLGCDLSDVSYQSRETGRSQLCVHGQGLKSLKTKAENILPLTIDNSSYTTFVICLVNW